MQAGPGPIYDLPGSLGSQISSKNTTFPGYKVRAEPFSLSAHEFPHPAAAALVHGCTLHLSVSSRAYRESCA
jgi:hypothetical protein